MNQPSATDTKNQSQLAEWQQILGAVESSGTQWLQTLGAPTLPANAQELFGTWLTSFAGGQGDTASWQQQFASAQKKLIEQFQATQSHESANDKRFASEAWQSALPYQMLADAYLATSKLLMQSVDTAELPVDEKKRARFFLKQYLDAVSPSNFLMTNPEAIKLAIETQGESLQHGAENLREDLEKGHVSITDESAFVVGKNIAVSPGAVVFENDIFQLIQYAPATPDVYLRPILFVPPCINKFYILDLSPGSSYIQYAVEQGHTVFVVSWRNVNVALGHLTWDDYIADGVIKAIDTVRVVTNVDRINALGFCVGGTMLACALAVLRRMGHDVVESATYLTTFIDFGDVGEIDAYIDAAFIEKREREVGLSAGGGIVNGADLSFAFSSLRANDLIWNYVVKNYLKGGKPPAFDLLYWNADSTNLPGPWYCWYVKNAYIENNLIKPDKLSVCGVPIDMRVVDMPSFVFAAKEDHIVPWRSVYASALALGGDVEFTLGASGHVAGVVNPASKNKRSYWQGDDTLVTSGRADQWLASSHEVPGSWWTRWSQWLSQYGGRKIASRQKLGSAAFPPIEAAPGRYVQEKHKQEK